MKRTIKTEHAAGLANGAKHGTPLPHSSPENTAFLYAQNVEKAKTATSGSYSEPLIKAYWQGYLEGMPKSSCAC